MNTALPPAAGATGQGIKPAWPDMNFNEAWHKLQLPGDRTFVYINRSFEYINKTSEYTLGLTSLNFMSGLKELSSADGGNLRLTRPFWPPFHLRPLPPRRQQRRQMSRPPTSHATRRDLPPTVEARLIASLRHTDRLRLPRRHITLCQLVCGICLLAAERLSLRP